MKERYFAKATSERVPFGQFLVSGKVLQVIDDKNLIATVEPIGGGDSSTVWIEGIDTGGYFDDADLGLKFFAMKLWQVNGTKSYTNTLGAKKTVPCFKPYPLDMQKVLDHRDLFEFGKHWNSFDQLLEASKEERKKAEAQAARDAKTRTWTDATGKFSVKAEYRGLAGDGVLLKKEDGKVVRIPLDRLNKADQDLINEWRKRAKK
jgi:hypothetical protein